MDIALFDLDNTLLDGDSDYAWALFLIEEGILERAEYERRNREYYEQYKQGTLDIMEYLSFQAGPLAGRPRAELDAWHARYMAQRVMPMILPKARELIRRHSAALTMIITATNRFITEPIARELGVPNLIACELETAGGCYTGRGTGVPSFQDGKIKRLEMWLEDEGKSLDGFERSYFYSDSLNDIPLLERVTHPVAVDPDQPLRAHAEARGWPIISLR